MAAKHVCAQTTPLRLADAALGLWEPGNPSGASLEMHVLQYSGLGTVQPLLGSVARFRRRSRGESDLHTSNFSHALIGEREIEALTDRLGAR